MRLKMPNLSLPWTYVMMTTVLRFLIGGTLKNLGYERLGVIFFGPGLLLWIALCFRVWLLFCEGIEYEDGD